MIKFKLFRYECDVDTELDMETWKDVQNLKQKKEMKDTLYFRQHHHEFETIYKILSNPKVSMRRKVLISCMKRKLRMKSKPEKEMFALLLGIDNVGKRCIVRRVADGLFDRSPNRKMLSSRRIKLEIDGVEVTIRVKELGTKI